MIKQVQVSTASWQVGRQVGKSKFWKTCLWIDYVVRYPIASLVAHELMSAWAQSCSRLLAIDLPIRLHTKSDYEFQIFNGFTSKYSPLISVNIYNWIEHRKSQDIDDSTTDRLFFSLQERHITLALSHLPLLLVCLLSLPSCLYPAILPSVLSAAVAQTIIPINRLVPLQPSVTHGRTTM